MKEKRRKKTSGHIGPQLEVGPIVKATLPSVNWRLEDNVHVE